VNSSTHHFEQNIPVAMMKGKRKRGLLLSFKIETTLRGGTASCRRNMFTLYKVAKQRHDMLASIKTSGY